MRAALTILLTFMLANPVSGQDHDGGSGEMKLPRQAKDPPLGFQIGFYSGYGWNSRGCSQCYTDQWTGGWVFGAKVGTRISKTFAADLLFHMWEPGTDLWKGTESVDYMRMTAAMHLAGYYYPLRNPFFFLKASAGYSVFHYTPSEPVILDNGIPMMGTISADGIGFGLGLGYSWMISDHIALTPAVDFQYQPFRELNGGIPGQVVSGAEGSRIFYLSLGMNYHAGNLHTRKF